MTQHRLRRLYSPVPLLIDGAATIFHHGQEQAQDLRYQVWAQYLVLTPARDPMDTSHAD